MSYKEFLEYVKGERMNNEYNSYPYYTTNNSIRIFSYQIDPSKSGQGILTIKSIDKIYTLDICNDRIIIDDTNNINCPIELNVKLLPITQLKEYKKSYNESLAKLVSEFNHDNLSNYLNNASKLIDDDFKLVYKQLDYYIKEDK